VTPGYSLAQRRGLVQLIDACEQFVRMRKSLGDKRKQISPELVAIREPPAPPNRPVAAIP
jgi:hypothetical protein